MWRVLSQKTLCLQARTWADTQQTLIVMVTFTEQLCVVWGEGHRKLQNICELGVTQLLLCFAIQHCNRAVFFGGINELVHNSCVQSGTYKKGSEICPLQRTCHSLEVRNILVSIFLAVRLNHLCFPFEVWA